MKKRQKHGKTGTLLYKRYHWMRQRCSSTNHPKSYLYNGKGISMCPEWDEDFEAFEAWALLNGFSPELSIDRIDSDKGYSPDNCRWVTNTVQSRNRKPNVRKGTSQYIGVYWDVAKQKWKAEVHLNNKGKFLGRFSSEVLAAQARDRFIIENNLEHTLNFKL